MVSQSAFRNPQSAMVNPCSSPRSLSLVGGLLSKVPYRAGSEVTEFSVPMFHALGFMQLVMGLALGSTLAWG